MALALQHTPEYSSPPSSISITLRFVLFDIWSDFNFINEALPIVICSRLGKLLKSNSTSLIESTFSPRFISFKFGVSIPYSIVFNISKNKLLLIDNSDDKSKEYFPNDNFSKAGKSNYQIESNKSL